MWKDVRPCLELGAVPRSPLGVTCTPDSQALGSLVKVQRLHALLTCDERHVPLNC